jgi:CubicO group peptidase (beta-lactamase class C family)
MDPLSRGGRLVPHRIDRRAYGWGRVDALLLFVIVPWIFPCSAFARQTEVDSIPVREQAIELPPSQPYGTRLSKVEDVLQAFADSTSVPGFAVTVAKKDDFFWSRAWGLADLATGRPMTPATRVRVGSISKPMTAALMGILFQEGILDLDAPVQEYVPSFPPKEWPVTVRQLAGHLGCVRHYESLAESLSNVHFETVEASLTPFADDPLVCEPGTESSYSTFGYALLSAVLEGAAGGEPFLDQMDRRVFSPMGLTDTRPDPGSLQSTGTGRGAPPDEDFATPYEPGNGGEPVLAPEVDLSNKWAGGGFISTAEDLARFALAHLEPSPLRRETVELLWTPVTTTDGNTTPYGLGWQAGRGFGDRLTIAHGGNAVGGLSVLILFPEEELVIAFSTNMGNAPIRGIPRRIAEIMVGEGA